MGFFRKSENDKVNLEQLRVLNEKNARAIQRIEEDELKAVKKRQAAIARRLIILQKELDVQTRSTLQGN